jgi:hypothetical protein
MARLSKAFDMRFHWVKDRVKANDIKAEWRAGNLNIADYLTKDHPMKHFLGMRSLFIMIMLM